MGSMARATNPNKLETVSNIIYLYFKIQVSPVTPTQAEFIVHLQTTER